MAGAYMGKILWIDLSEGKWWDEELDEQIYKDFLGGGFAGAFGGRLKGEGAVSQARPKPASGR